jgi:DNA polymerase III subunit delta'
VVGPDGALPLPWLKPWLDRALQTQRAHAVLVHGAQGIGQWELALSLAQAWLCEDAAATKPCGRCASCRLVQAHSHPDLLVLLPEALQESLGWANADEQSVASDKASKSRQPSKDIKVDAVRAAVAFAQTTAARGQGKVLLIHPAERMNGVAANALLKTLEEPPGNARFILCCSAPDALLPTIRSRCQALALALPSSGQSVRWLASQGVKEPEVMLAAAGGQPLEALAWAQQGIDADGWARLPQRVISGDASAVAGWPLPRVIEALQKLCHDALSVRVGALPRYFPQDSIPAQTSMRALLSWAEALAKAARHAEHPFNAGLMAESLVGQGQGALNAAAPGRGRGAPDSVHSRR